MPNDSREVRPFHKPGRALSPSGEILTVPVGWTLLPPGDAALSRRIKADGPHWLVVELKGRKRFSRGIYAPAHRIAALKEQLAAERADPAYERKLETGRRRRAAQQADYVEDFKSAVYQFLAFHPRYRLIADDMAARIAAHATPVGSGTVARTQRIPIERRAESATIAWMRHQTTAYDHMRIARIKGERREVRRQLAQRSRQLLDAYRRGVPIDSDTCPLQRAMRHT